MAINVATFVVVPLVMESATIALGNRASLTIFSSTRRASSFGVFKTMSEASFNIINEINDGSSVSVNCGATAGSSTIKYDEIFGFAFTPNFWGGTTFKCAFRWGKRAREFTVWIDYDHASPRRRGAKCKHCVWRVTPRGFFLNDFGDPVPMFIVGWLPPPRC